MGSFRSGPVSEGVVVLVETWWVVCNENPVPSTVVWESCYTETSLPSSEHRSSQPLQCCDSLWVWQLRARAMSPSTYGETGLLGDTTRVSTVSDPVPLTPVYTTWMLWRPDTMIEDTEEREYLTTADSHQYSMRRYCHCDSIQYPIDQSQ